MRSKICLIILVGMVFSCQSNDEPNGYNPVFECNGTIYNGNVQLENQEDVNAFGACGFTEVNGDLSIYNGFATPITDLSPLSTITSVDKLGLAALNDLTNLNGLENLMDVEILTIFNCPNLLSIQGLNNIQPQVIELNDNPVLNNLNALNLQSSTLTKVVIIGSPQLANLNFLSNVSVIRSSLYIDDTGVVNLNGLQSVVSIGTEFGAEVGDAFKINNNLNLQSLAGLENLSIVGEDLRITGNLALTDYCALSNLFTNGNISGEFETNGNSYNPTTSQMINGNCSN